MADQMLSGWGITRRLLFEPWRWLLLTVLWTVFTHATTIRDNFLPVDWRPHLQVLDHLPTWPWWVWIIGVLALTVIMLFLTAFRLLRRFDRALHDRPLPGRNADEIAPWQERGR